MHLERKQDEFGDDCCERYRWQETAIHGRVPRDFGILTRPATRFRVVGLVDVAGERATQEGFRQIPCASAQ